ncbi:hypothetical protein D6D01_06309 [Aureobasidium pullulans]|uniref:Uncharacterized protein n=1 Tax=Aureobasidium pullulans TaxID=5580 RepID=A0A4S9L1V5_AURPU|nr:hypothetical protein D6D01_06309 [Aureobasidium pullulans]
MISSILPSTALGFSKTSTIMRDFFASLPAPLPLYILLDLPDLKALYAAILSSPHLSAVFHLNARLIFTTIIRRTMPDDLVTPLTMYMRLHQHSKTTTSSTSGSLEATMLVDDANPYTWDDISPATFFQAIAQYVKIYDLAYSTLRLKLDYLATLQFEKLANLPHKFIHKSMAKQNPESVPLNVPARFQDPSWVEESRAVRALWFLTLGWRVSCMLGLDESESIDIAKRLVGEKSWKHEEIEEMARSVLDGPTWLPPTPSPASNTTKTNKSFSALQSYPILRHSRVTCPDSSTNISTSFLYGQSPLTPPPSTPASLAWDQAPQRLSTMPRVYRILLMLRDRPDSPFRTPGTRPHNARTLRIDHFIRLGFGVWDLWRLSVEMRLWSMPYSIREELKGEGQGRVGVVGQSDSMFRHWVIWRQEKQREEVGWKRGFNPQSQQEI